jgi:hypothetical protein
MTKRDLLERNVDLIAKACELLAQRPAYGLSVRAASGGLKVRTAGLDRVDVYVGGRPRQTLDVSDGEHTVSVNAAGALVDVQGFDGGELVALRRVASG